MKLRFFRRAALPALFAVAVAAGAAAAPASAQNANNITVIVNGQRMSFDQPPIEQAGRVYVPLRGIFQQLGASVVYQNGTINATGNGRNVTLHIGSNQATVNGQTQMLSSPPFLQGARTLVPLRFVAQALGATVDWNNNTSTVTIDGSGNSGYNNNNNNNSNYQPTAPPMAPTAYVVDESPRGVVPPGLAHTVSGRFSVPVRHDTVRVTLDGNDVTSSVYFNGDRFQFNTPNSLGLGPHEVRISGVTRDGASFSTGWRFVI
jgi:hypothetical protein